MKRPDSKEPWRDPVLGPCACSQLRRTARAVSSLYDGFLGRAGVTVTQYALLVNIARAGRIARTELAGRLGMERTTLTRNLRPLVRDGLVNEETGADRREHLLFLTAAGRRRLEQAFTCWSEAQQSFVNDFGEEPLQQLRELLKRASEAARRASASESDAG